MPSPRDLTHTIAVAIRAADRRYFFEDYTAQATAVLSALKRAGLTIVPAQPTAEMMDAGKQGMRYGRQRPAELLKLIYQAMVGAAPR